MSATPPPDGPAASPDPPPAPIVVPVYFDFASSIAYVAHRVMERMRPDLDALGIELRWTAIDLARLLGWRPGEAIDGPRRDNALRVARELDVDLRMPRLWIDSRRPNAWSHVLADPRAEAAWRERVWSAIFEQGRDPGDATEWARLVAASDEACSDGPRTAGGIERDLERGLASLERATRRAAEEMVAGVPTFMLGGWPFGGIQEEATMRSILGRHVRRLRRRGAAPPEGGVH